MITMQDSIAAGNEEKQRGMRKNRHKKEKDITGKMRRKKK